MRTPNSAKELLLSLPIKVRFAGFTGDTLSLAKSGWDLSMREGHSYATADYELQLAMRHEGAKLYGITHPLRIPHEHLYSVMGDQMAYAKFVALQEFEIQAIAPGIQFMRIPVRGESSWANGFAPIDASPQWSEAEDISRKANPNLKDIVVLPEMVPDLLAKVLEAQGPAMEEIRKRERSRENMAAYREGMFLGGTPQLKPAHQVQLQLVTLTA
jgi:hypothetical protein